MSQRHRYGYVEDSLGWQECRQARAERPGCPLLGASLLALVLSLALALRALVV